MFPKYSGTLVGWEMASAGTLRTWRLGRCKFLGAVRLARSKRRLLDGSVSPERPEESRNMRRIERLEIRGLFGDRDIDIRPRGQSIILVGPNGIGKSSVVNILYFFISRQWSRLLDYNFEEIVLHVDGDVISAQRHDITGLFDLRKTLAELPPNSRVRSHYEKLSALELIEEFMTTARTTPQFRKRYAEILGIASEEVPSLLRYLQQRSVHGQSDLFPTPRISLEKALSETFPTRSLYLPTYRRIEKDLRDVFPDFEERYRTHTSATGVVASGRSASHYIDLVSFGMEDVRKSFDTRTREMRDYSLEQYNNLSALYLKDVIRGTADNFVPKSINDLTEDGIKAILGRVSETTLSSVDKSLVLEKIKSIQGKSKSKIAANDRFLAHYVTRLVDVNDDITTREQDISSFVDVCNQYLQPSKSMQYDEIYFKVVILDERGRPIDLSVLSSGEKQVVSIFSHLYLDKTSQQIVVIDEPELSLSVPWQKRFLTDIIDSGQCDFLAAVTHSPFIYENRLRESAVDLRRRTTIRQS